MWWAFLACVATPVDSDSDTDPVDSGDDPPPPVTFTMVGFNVESGGSIPEDVAEGVVATIRGESLWGFSEVEDEAAAQILTDAAADPDSGQVFDHITGTTGWQDRLVLAWDTTRFEVLDHEELDEINVGGTARAPLVARVREISTGTEFLWMVNHLWRSDNAARHEQAELLNAWAAEQALPVVMHGDYNFDWEVDGSSHDQGYDNLTEGGVLTWVRPATLVPTLCSSYYDSVLDFVFVGGGAQTWTASSEILRPDDLYCAYRYIDTWSDHRPVAATFTW